MARQPRLRIIFSAILNRDITLVSHQDDDSVDLSQTLQEVKESIKTLEQTSYEQKLTFPMDRYLNMDNATTSNLVLFNK